MKAEEKKVGPVAALVEIDGDVHLVNIPQEELLGMLKSWFEYKGKPFQVSHEPLNGIFLESATKLP